MAVMPLSQIAILAPGSTLRKYAVKAYADAAIAVCKREGLWAAHQLYAIAQANPSANTALEVLKTADATAGRERAAKLADLPKVPATTKPTVSVNKDPYETTVGPPATQAPPPSGGIMQSIKSTLGPQGPLILAGAAGVVLLLLFIPKKKR